MSTTAGGRAIPHAREAPAIERHQRYTLENTWHGRDNGIGALRLLLALAVVFDHAGSLGFGWEDLGTTLFRGQTNVGTIAVYGFFVISGLLITRSARRTGLVRFAWHRALRILPGLWVCLLVTAFAVAPLVALYERGTLAGFWGGPKGPVQYVTGNWFTGVRQYGIHDLLAETPWGRQIGSTSVFDGALWSLIYETTCYAAVAGLAVTAVLRRARWLVPAAAGVLLGIVAADQLRGWIPTGPPSEYYGAVVLPLLGTVSVQWLIHLGALFLIGATIELYRERVPISDQLAAACGVALAVSLLFGGFFITGFPALAYLLVWAAVRMPRRLRRIGATDDYSYGIYIYGFVVQQVLATLGVNAWGYAAYTGISLALTVALAAMSWHLVERRALTLKDLRLPAAPRRRPARASRPASRANDSADAEA
ncbi:acyltransferase family protein [Dactylosporangium sucinum]|uniref:O-antigen acetylase n=1 Tax=Dactylosporangium sucinum TaxID=1424081 RepID=A0A917U473_9ACTN|nr:acyltransferase [Dactylosporangium sucinum]GGM55772.1 O-antigen acetylase [Dactylosporangium sucinum]